MLLREETNKRCSSNENGNSNCKTGTDVTKDTNEAKVNPFVITDDV